MQLRLTDRHFTSELGRFLWGWVHNPRAVGALAPSGRELARLMVAGIGPGARVVELGAGTGTFTRAILAAQVAPEDLFVVERDAFFARLLQSRFPDVAIFEQDAVTAGRALHFLAGQIDFVVSGLPLLLLSRAQRLRVLAGAFSLLGKGGVMHQFTYGARCPIDARMLARLGLVAKRTGTAARNFPPARVYRISRENEQECLARVGL